MKYLSGFIGFTILALCILPIASAPAQSNQPAIEYSSFMNLRFYEQTGGFLVEHLQMVFPPEGNQPMEFVINRVGGGAAATIPLRVNKWHDYPVFDGLEPNGVPGVIQLGEPGDYIMAVKINGQAVTSLPFTMKVESSSDPFNPKKTFTREGPWRTLAYVSVPIDKPDDALHFNLWVCLRELPSGMKRPLCTVQLLRAGKEIAASEAPFVISSDDWQFFTTRIVQPRSAGGHGFTMAMLTRQDGEYKIQVKVEGKTIKTYSAMVKGGQLQRLERCRLDTNPHTAFISPRLIDTSAGTTSRYRMLDAYWVEADSK